MDNVKRNIVQKHHQEKKIYLSLFRFQIKSDIAESLKEMDIAVPEDPLYVVLLCSLPDDFKSFVVA